MVYGSAPQEAFKLISYISSVLYTMKNYGTQEAGDNATPKETENTMWPVIEIGGGSSSVTPPWDQQTQDVHGGHAGSQDLLAACVLCGKQFPNKKSLGGHMSMHPERPWRGLYAPESGQSSVSSARDGGTTALASMQIDLNQPAPEE